MPFEDDPFRMLGLQPGASLNEIRSAYRRLAKKYHPDAAGDRALPRFLAIQTAYERLVDGDGRLRRPSGGSAGGGSRGSGGRSTGGRGSAQEPWQADASRARASREAWRARRSGGEGWHSAAGRGADDGPGRGAGREPGSQAGPGASEDPGRSGGRSPGRERDRRFARRATAGSTTYDEAAETPLDPEWDGGEWYGPSSGTYWTINPREYADPRKHGPEYQARARRSTGPEGDEADAATMPDPGDPTQGREPTRGLEPIVRRPGRRSLLAILRRATSR